jgi:hypothetical protein
MTTPNATWLEQLENEIWAAFPPDRFGYVRYHEARLLTQDELARVLTLAKSGDFVVRMFNAVMGFGVGISLSTPPPYPGTDAYYRVAITNAHVDDGKGDHVRFKEAWELFAPIALSEANQRLVEFTFGQRLSTEQSYYDY